MTPRGQSRAYRLKRSEKVGEGMRRLATGRAENALERLRGVEPGSPDSAAAVHAARKDLKKLRAVVRLLRDELGRKLYAEENRRYRDAGRALSASRDAEVKVETLEAIAERFPDLEAGLLGAWRLALEHDREQAAAVSDEIAATESIELIEEGRDRIADWDLGNGSWDLIDRGVVRIYERGRRAMRRAEADPSEENLHGWRKRAKDLWYVLRILHGAWPEVLGASAEEAHKLTDMLGEHHDLAELRRDLAGRSFPDDGSQALAEAILTREEELAGTAFELGHRLYAEKPRAFRRRIGVYWKAWRI